MKAKNRSVLLYAFVSAASFGAAGWCLPNPSQLELKDQKGNVRCRIGQLDANGDVFGWQVLGEKGTVHASAWLDGDSMHTSVGDPRRPQTMFRVRSDADGVQMVFGDGATSSLFVGVSESGQMMQRFRDKEGNDWFSLLCDPVARQESSLSLRSKGQGKVQPSVKWLANRSGARGGVFSGMGDSKTEGVAMQAAKAGHLIELRHGRPVVTLQVAPGGAGLGVDTPSGEPAIRVGVDAAGKVKAKLGAENK